jgi:hypothetical protein
MGPHPKPNLVAARPLGNLAEPCEDEGHKE